MRTEWRLAISVCLTTFATIAQQPPRLTFEVASIKPGDPGSHDGGFNYGANGRFTAHVPLHFLIASAYHLRQFQLTGGPGWIENTPYDIEAKAEGRASPEQIMSMVQTLLEDRFQLKAHLTTKEHELYALVPAKGGLKLHGSTADCDALASAAHPGKQCGSWSESANEIVGTKISMEQFVQALSESVELPVIDKTGFKGMFDVKLDWIPGANTSADDSAGPSIFAALQEQLGLKLESRKGAVEMLVIDHIEKPSEN